MNKLPTFGIIIDNPYGGHYQMELSDGIRAFAYENNVNLLYYLVKRLDSPYYWETGRAILYDFINPNYISGLLLFTGSLVNYCSLLDFANLIKQYAPIPMVSIAAEIPGVPSIVIDNEKGLTALLKHLIEYHNYKTIAFVSGTKDNADAQSRLSVYKDVLTSYNLPVEKKNIYHGDFWRSSGILAVDEFLDKRKIMPEAIVAANDYMAIGILEALTRRNIKVPDEIAITGFDNLLMDEYIMNPFTTVNQPLFEIGYRAAKTLFSIINNQGTPEPVQVIPSRPIIRNTCGCISALQTEKEPFIETISEQDTDNSSRLLVQDKIIKQLLKITDITSGIDLLHMWQEFLDESVIMKRKQEQVDIFFLEIKEKLVSNIKDQMVSKTTLHYLLEMNTMIHKVYKHSGFINYIVNTYQPPDFPRSLNSLTQKLITSNKIQENLYLLSNPLTEVRISDFYLCIYLDPINPFDGGSRLIFAWSDHAIIPLPEKGIVFHTLDLLPDSVIPKKRIDYMIEAMYQGDSQIGFILMSSGAKGPKNTYNTITRTLSSTIDAVRIANELIKLNKRLQAEIATGQIKAKEAEEAHKQKIMFFINLAHETKTPLTLILNYLDSYIRKKGSNYDLDIIVSNIRKLSRDMINFLDAEKLEQGRMVYDHNQMTNISNLLETIVVLYNKSVAKKNIKLTKHVEPKLLIKADPYAIERILLNLMDNAFKYTDQGGEINISLISTAKMITFTIADTGKGMSDKEISVIFKPYHQLSHKKTNIQGIGMGLFIVKEIIESLKAKIDVKSTRGKGATFTITFKKHLTDKKEKMKTIIKDSDFSDKVHVAITLKEPDIIPGRRNLLIVEDNREMLSFLISSLSDIYNVFFAENGLNALKKLLSIPMPDIIISDIMMDEMDGHEFCRKIKENKDFLHIPFIFLTAKNREEDKLKGFSEGAIYYINKPFKIEEVKAEIKSLLESRERHTEHIRKKIGDRIMDIFHDTKQLENENQYNMKILNMYEKYNLTRREREIVGLLRNGLLNKEISIALNISQKTVEVHLYNIFRKIGVQNRVELLNLLYK